MSQAQCRAKRGASFARRKGIAAGETEGVPAVVKTNKTTAGTGDKICC